MIKSVSTVRELRLVLETWRRREETIGFIPTSGTLHAGHVALLRHAQDLSTRVVASIFSNPMHASGTERSDLPAHQLDMDAKLLGDNGCDLLFTPTVDAMYPQGFSTRIDPGPMGAVLEGIFKPGHFTDIATATVKLLLQVMPDYAFFGERDYQQLRIIEQVVRDLHLPVNIIPVPIYRDVDDLAVSAATTKLSAEDKKRALLLPQAMRSAAEDIRDGLEIETTLLANRAKLEAGGLQVDYFDLVETRGLTPARDLRKPVRLMVAVRLGKIRLTDNIAV